MLSNREPEIMSILTAPGAIVCIGEVGQKGASFERASWIC